MASVNIVSWVEIQLTYSKVNNCEKLKFSKLIVSIMMKTI